VDRWTATEDSNQGVVVFSRRLQSLDTTQGALIAMTWIAKHVALIELSTAPSIFHP
jgi:hypothetical protein